MSNFYQTVRMLEDIVKLHKSQYVSATEHISSGNQNIKSNLQLKQIKDMNKTTKSI